MAIGRITGSVLKSNLTRNGVDLAFETNLLYLDVTNSRVGIGTSEPTATLHVNGNTNITGNLTGVTDVTASGTTQTDIIKNREQRYTTSNMMKFNQLYTGASAGSYFSANEYQKVVTITPSGDSQNYQVIGRITAQNAGETHVVNFNAALRSNTLPDLGWSIFYDEDYNGSRYIDPQLWTKETTTAGFIFAFKTLATIYGTVTVDFDVIPRTSALLSNVSINTTQDSEQTSVDTGFTANDMTRVVRKQSSNVNINGTITASAITGLSSATISNTSTGDSLLITSTEDSSTAAPVITLKRDSASPADADYLGQLKFKGENDADQEIVYSKITGKIQDASDGTEDGIIEFANIKAGSQTITARLRSDSFQLLNDTNLVVRGLTYPTADGTTGQVIKTDGSGNLSFTTISTNSVSQGDSNVTVTDSGTGSVTIDADGSTIITMNATTVLDASATTNAIRLPGGTTAQRPSGAVGEIRYNSTTDTIEGYTTAGGWAQLGATTSTSENTDDTATDVGTAISTTEKVINSFTTASFDSAWYLAITRDEINDEVATAKYSMVHNDSDAFVAASHIIKEGTNTQISVDADVSAGNVRLKATGTSVVNSVSFYRIGLGDNTSASTTGNVTTTINTDVDSAAEKIDGWALASYRGAKYYISVNNTTTGELSNLEALVVHDGSTAYINQYGGVNTGNNDLITLTAEVDSTEVVVKASAQAPNCRVTVYRILLADDEGGSTGDNVNVIAATTVSSTATTVDSFNNSTYTGAFYVFTGYNAGEGAASISEVMVVSNADVFVGTGPSVSTKGTDQLEFSATQSGTSVTVKASSTSGSSTTVNGYRVHMLRGSAGASTADTVLVSTTQTITGAKTFTGGFQLGSGATVTNILDEDNLASNSATALATQQSIKAYVDSATGGGGSVVGDFTFTGSTMSSPSNADITLDPSGTGVVRITSNILPDTTETYDIGSTSLRFNDIFLAGATVDIGGTKITKDSNGDIEIKDNSNNRKKIIVDEIHLGDGDNKVKLSRGANGRLKKTDNNGVALPVLTVVGDDSSGTDFNMGEDLKIAGAGDITTAMSGDTLTVTGPTLTAVSSNVVPDGNGTRDLGSSSNRWANIYTSDLNLNNGIGNYTIVEGEDDLFLYNNKSGKTYKFMLAEVDPNTVPKKMEK